MFDAQEHKAQSQVSQGSRHIYKYAAKIRWSVEIQRDLWYFNVKHYDKHIQEAQ